MLENLLNGRILSLEEADRWLKGYINDQFKTTDKSEVHRDVDKDTFQWKY